MTSVDIINKSVLDLWAKNKPADDRPPLLYPPLEEDGILFIGCNPAWAVEMNLSSFSALLADPSLADNLIESEIKSLKTYPYFKPCREIADELGCKWAHVDWFFIRETSQQKLEESVLVEAAQWKAPVQLTPFAKAQVELSKQLINQCSPKVIVVINALASKIARTEFSLYSTQLDEEGLYWADLAGRKIPIILSGMLTGQRALDHGSFERLKWHIGKSLMDRTQLCPFCHAEVEKSTRYPDYACEQCAKSAADAAGRGVGFSNRNWEGGIKGSYNDTNEAYPSRSCFINRHPCTASEARFGGIVITPNEK